jgi:hypothetical protein
MLGKGSTAIEAMLRLSSKYGGTTKLLNQQKQTGCCG